LVKNNEISSSPKKKILEIDEIRQDSLESNEPGSAEDGLLQQQRQHDSNIQSRKSQRSSKILLPELEASVHQGDFFQHTAC